MKRRVIFRDSLIVDISRLLHPGNGIFRRFVKNSRAGQLLQKPVPGIVPVRKKAPALSDGLRLLVRKNLFPQRLRYILSLLKAVEVDIPE